MCVCEKASLIYLKMRGLCKSSSIDTYWVPHNYRENKDPYVYVGLTSSRISFNPDTEKWNLVTYGKKKNPIGSSEAILHGVLLGKSQWLIENDGLIEL